MVALHAAASVHAQIARKVAVIGNGCRIQAHLFRSDLLDARANVLNFIGLCSSADQSFLRNISDHITDSADTLGVCVRNTDAELLLDIDDEFNAVEAHKVKSIAHSARCSSCWQSPV
jgi:hypothetical protein